MEKKLKEMIKAHADKPASKAHKGLRKGGKTNLDMKKFGRNMAKVMNQRSSGRGR
jgi:hypothetical protein